MNKRIELYSLIAGLVFLISGIAKAIDISVFSNVIAQYGFDNLKLVSPLIVIAEVTIGGLLVFQIWQKWSALGGVLLISIFTLIFAYGLIFKGIEDCGCFGRISVLNTFPFITFIRNAVLLYLLIAVFRKSTNNSEFNKWAVYAIVAIVCCTAFMSGYTFRFIQSDNAKKFTAKSLKDTSLKQFVSTNKDSTYLVFAFSYSCPHCLNSIANLKEYEQFGVVDKVIGLALGDTVLEKRFREIFKPNFSIKNYSKELLDLTNVFPTAFYIKNDSILMELSGELPCSYIFEKSIRN